MVAESATVLQAARETAALPLTRMTPQEFIAKWGPGGPAFELNERQGAQPHFMDLCALLQVPTPGSLGDRSDYLFEQNTLVLGEARGYADVFYRDHFAWENKAPGKNLDAALKQLLGYSHALANPPLLVVCDRLSIRIQTQFNGHPSEQHTVRLHELDQPVKQALLRRLWTDVESFRPKITSRDITEAAAKSFATLAEGLRKRGHHPDTVAHFLTQCLFCFFAEDVGLLPGRMFDRLVGNRKIVSEQLTQGLASLFTTMRDGGLYGPDEIPWFNGGLFKKIDVPKLEILDITELRNAAGLNWSAIDVSIFGTLFERGLDPAKRSQLGAHYTDTATIARIIEPVLRRPLLQKWELVAKNIRELMAKSTRKGDTKYRASRALFVQWLEELKAYRVLDPACGSGNFLFLGLKALKDVEHQSHLDAAACGLDREADLMTGPHNLLGLELNEYAAELARVTVWIGELQWRLAHGYDFKTNPVLEPLDHIECRDALLSFTAARSEFNTVHPEPTSVRPEPVELGSSAVSSQARAGQMLEPHTLRFLKSAQSSAPPTPGSGEKPSSALGKPAGQRAVEAQWPKASVVIGNPPFLGGSKKRRELGDAYFEALSSVYAGRVPGGADLVCYWFDKALKAIETDGLGAAGLVATQSIRSGSNRVVLDAIRHKNTQIFDAWSDEPWINDGAAVRVSLVSFGWGECCFLNGQKVDQITSELSSAALSDMTQASHLVENTNASFEGTKKYGDFDISGKLAREWLRQPNPHGKSNSAVVKPWRNGQDVTRRPSDTWVIDFGPNMDEAVAALFEQPFSHLIQHVKPERMKVRRDRTKRLWWIHEEARVSLREGLDGLRRFIVTPRVAKHRFFVFLDETVLPDTRLNVIARADDTTFGILSSRLHEAWSLANASMHGVGNDPTYNAKSCFETFPFPTGLTPADTAHQVTEVVQGGALIPAVDQARCKAEADRTMGAISKSKRSAAYERPASGLPPPEQSEAASTIAGQVNSTLSQAQSKPSATRTVSSSDVRQIAIQIAIAAKRLNDLREAWLNPPEWTRSVPEVIPLGLATSPYPDRIEPKPGLSEADLKALQKRTLTNLYNQRPAWLHAAHETLDAAVAAAYGWADYTPAMTDDEILQRLLALNLARAKGF